MLFVCVSFVSDKKYFLVKKNSQAPIIFEILPCKSQNIYMD